MKQSVVLENAINRLMGLAEVNREFMDADDYGELQTTIKELVKMRHEKAHSEYRSQIKSFVDYLRDGVTAADGDEWTDWCQTPYIITHGDKKVTVDNGPETYEGIISLLEDHLEDIG